MKNGDAVRWCRGGELPDWKGQRGEEAMKDDKDRFSRSGVARIAG